MKYKAFGATLILMIFSLLSFQSCQNKPVADLDVIFVSKPLNPAGINTVTATCPEGSQMVGGGYTITPNYPNKGVNVRASFPLDKNTWEADVLYEPGSNAEPATLTVYAYYYKGAKDAGMIIASNEASFTAPSLGIVNAPFSSDIAKPFSTDVITAGGFKLSPANSIDEINVTGSYPAISSKPGIIDNVAGWTNNFSVFGGKTCTIRNFILYSRGKLQIPGNIPLFDQGTAIKQNSLTSGKTDPFYQEVEVNKDYFCTGGGYKRNGKSIAPGNTQPINVWQNNANTKSGVFFGWQFSGHDFNASYEKPDFDIYALPIKFH
jgi:hypothetical protein